MRLTMIAVGCALAISGVVAHAQSSGGGGGSSGAQLVGWWCREWWIICRWSFKRGSFQGRIGTGW
jgi:hypothetical protein